LGRGAKREGKEIEKAGLMQEDTEGKVEFIRLTTTNSKDCGVDFIKFVHKDFNYKKYNNKLKKKGKL
jgi:hypothetical protein